MLRQINLSMSSRSYVFGEFGGTSSGQLHQVHPPPAPSGLQIRIHHILDKILLAMRNHALNFAAANKINNVISDTAIRILFAKLLTDQCHVPTLFGLALDLAAAQIFRGSRSPGCLAANRHLFKYHRIHPPRRIHDTLNAIII